MNSQTRRGILKSTAALAGAAALGLESKAQKGANPRKKAINNTPPGKKPSPNYSDVVITGNLVYLSGVGGVGGTTIQEQTKSVLDALEANLKFAGTSMENVVKINVYLSDIANFAGMNSVYVGRFGPNPPVRTTIAAAGIVGGALVEIDCVATL